MPATKTKKGKSPATAAPKATVDDETERRLNVRGWTERQFTALSAGLQAAMTVFLGAAERASLRVCAYSNANDQDSDSVVVFLIDEQARSIRFEVDKNGSVTNTIVEEAIALAEKQGLAVKAEAPRFLRLSVA